ncbi:hypothetical protein [Thermomonospora amylolytica]|uniref:hypothetical protein n=1 Tax=Thermomonospora amylolytica TaxID=1411117 RepID=UPI00130076F7|nr:hypothetical protein [Thermomonospora amylolytica]
MSTKSARPGSRLWPLKSALLNLGLGGLGVLPLHFGRSFLHDHPLAALGVTSPAPNDVDDGAMVAVVLVVVLTLPMLGAFVLANVLAADTAGFPQRHWGLAVLMFLLPTMAATLWPSAAAELFPPW